MTIRRLESVEKQCRRNPAFGTLYGNQISAYITKGYSRKLSAAEANIRTNRTWYLPHFGVQSPHKPGKLRLVFDAAATVNGMSLNSALLKRPDLNQPLAKILFKFRL